LLQKAEKNEEKFQIFERSTPGRRLSGGVAVVAASLKPPPPPPPPPPICPPVERRAMCHPTAHPASLSLDVSAVPHDWLAAERGGGGGEGGAEC